MSNMFRNANKVPNPFLGGRRKLRFMEFVINFLVEMKPKQGTDVNSDTRQCSQWNIADGGVIHVVQEKADIKQGKKPCACRCANTVHDTVGGILDSLPSAFNRVLLLLVWFTLPGFDKERAQDVQNLVANLNLSTITDQFSGCTTLTNVVLQGVDELGVSLNAINICDMGLGAIEDDSSLSTMVNSRGVRIHNVT